MITALLAWLIVQSLIQVKLIESVGVSSAAPLRGRSGFAGSKQVSHSWKKTKKREKKTNINSSKGPSYVIFDNDNTEDKTGEGVQIRTIVLIEQQMTTQLNEDQSNDDDSSNNTDMTDDDDSDFELANDDTTSSIDSLILTDEEDEEDNIPSPDDNDVVGEILNIDSESDSNNDDNDDTTDDNEHITVDNDNLEEGVERDDEGSDKNNSNSISELKKLWSNVILSAKNDQLNQRSQEILSAVQHQINENSSISESSRDIESYRNVPLVSVLSQFPILLRANGTDSASFNRQLESQLHDPLALGQRALWLDQEFALVLKGEKVTKTVISRSCSVAFYFIVPYYCGLTCSFAV